jgi:hypothetical protein
MRRSATIALRFVVLATLVIGLAALFAPAPRTNSPYLSALSDVGLGTPAMAKLCHSKCNPLTNTCVDAHCGLKDCDVLCVFSGSTCSTQTCP